MLKTLFATSLLLFSCSSGSLKHDVLDQPYQSNKRELLGNSLISGGYNWRNSFVEPESYENESFSIYFDLGQSSPYANCVSNKFAYINKLEFNYISSGDYYQIVFYYYPSGNHIDDISSFTFGLYMDEEINDVTSNYRDLIFYNRGTFYVTDNQFKIFNSYFTSQDNIFVTTYNGYYSFDYSVNTFTQFFQIYGIIYGDLYYYSMSNVTTAEGNTQLNATLYSFENQYYYTNLIFKNGLPQNLNFTGVKMTRSTYSYLGQIGVFNYVRDTTHDNDTFKDLLFGVMDSPLYFIHMLLNFELFGTSVYIAFASLLTVLLAILFIRKFL